MALKQEPLAVATVFFTKILFYTIDLCPKISSKPRMPGKWGGAHQVHPLDPPMKNRMPGKWGGRAPGAPPPRSANVYIYIRNSVGCQTCQRRPVFCYVSNSIKCRSCWKCFIKYILQMHYSRQMPGCNAILDTIHIYTYSEVNLFEILSYEF